jgi:hypothetical protein
VALVPAMAFYGGLDDLLRTAAAGDWAAPEEVRLAVALDSWHPTRGTRRTGERNTAPRLAWTDGWRRSRIRLPGANGVFPIRSARSRPSPRR